MIEQALHVRIPIDVEVRIWITIAAKERLQSKRAGGMFRPCQYNIARKIGHQVSPSKNKGAQEQLPELGIRLDQVLQCRAIELDQLTRLRNPALHHCAAARKNINFACEIPGLLRAEDRLHTLRMADDLDSSADDDENAGRIAGI